MTAPLVVKQSVETIEWTPEGVVMIDQTRLPRETDTSRAAPIAKSPMPYVP